MPDRNHNDGQYLAVVDQTGVRYGRGMGRDGVKKQRPSPPGWYVIRTCLCHEGLPVSRRYSTRAEAEKVRVLLLDITV